MNRAMIIGSMVAVLLVNGVARSQETRFGGQLDMSITSDLNLELEAEVRSEKHFTTFETALVESAVSYELGDYFEIKTGYRHAFIPDNFVATGSPDVNEDRLTMSFYAEKEVVEDLDVQYRGRYQWAKEVEGSDSDHRQYFRNRLKLDYNLTSIADPYMSYEFYYRIDRRRAINQWRIEIGLDIELTDNMDMDVFYRHQRDVNIRIPDTDRIIEVNLQYNLDF